MVGAPNQRVAIEEHLRSVVQQSERFELRSELGRGGDGIVFEVFDRQRDGHVALKLVRSSDADTEARIASQVALSAELAHPNLVTFFDHGDLDGHAFCTMEPIEGQDILSYVAADPTKLFDEEKVRASVAQLVDVLATLHDTCRVHRDVKPDNVFVTKEGRVVLLDLGLAGDFGELEAPDAWAGTEGYIAPEQHRGERVGAEADLYAVGAILHQMLTGRLPPSEGAASRQLREQAPAELASMCERLLDPEPTRRPQPGRILRTLGAGLTTRPLTGFRAPPGCFGRDREQASLLGTLNGMRETGGWLHIQAPAGRGKRHLVSHVVRQVDAATFCARCDPLPRTAQGVLDALITQAAIHAQQSVPDVLTAPAAEHACWLPQLSLAARAIKGAPADGPLPEVPDPLERRLRALEALRTFFARLAGQRPVILWVDDAHLLPTDALAALHAVWRPPTPASLILVTTSCADVAIPDVPQTRQTLEPLDRTGSRALAEAFLEEAGSEAVLDDLEVGEPWQVVETARALAAGLPAQTTPSESMVKRIEELPEGARELLRLLATASRQSVPYQECLLASNSGENALSQGIAQLEAAGFVRRADSPLRAEIKVENAVVRTTVLGALTEEQYAHCASRWLTASRGSKAVPPRVIASYMRDTGDAAGAARLLRKAAADLTGRLAFGTAADLLEQAVVLDPPSRDDEGRALHRTLGDAQVLAGRNLQAAESFLHASDGAVSAERIELQHKRAGLLFHAGRVDEGTSVAHSVLKNVGLALPETEQRALPSLLWHQALLALRGYRHTLRDAEELPAVTLAQSEALWQVGNMLLTADGVRGLELISRATRLALKTGVRSHIARALLRQSMNRVNTGKPPFKRAERELALARELIDGHPDPYFEAFADLAEGLVLTYSGHAPDQAIQVLRRADKRFADDCSNTLWDRPRAQQTILYVLAMRLRLEEAETCLYQFLQEAALRGDRQSAIDLNIMGNFCVRALRHDDVVGARRALSEIRDELPGEHIGLQHFTARLSSCHLELYDYQDDSLERMDTLLEPIADTLIVKSPVGKNLIRMVRIPLMLRRAETLEGEARRTILREALKMLRKIEHSGHSITEMAAVRTWPFYHLLAGDIPAAQKALTAAETALTKNGDPLFFAHYVQGRLMRSPEGDALARSAVAGLKQAGVGNVQRSLAMFGATEIDRMLGPLHHTGS